MILVAAVMDGDLVSAFTETDLDEGPVVDDPPGWYLDRVSDALASGGRLWEIVVDVPAPALNELVSTAIVPTHVTVRRVEDQDRSEGRA